MARGVQIDSRLNLNGDKQETTCKEAIVYNPINI